MDTLDRARQYLAKIPAAVSGEKGHNQTLAAASALVWGFALDENQAMPLIREYNSRCSPPWTDAELSHKLHDAADASRKTQPRGHLLANSMKCKPSPKPWLGFIRKPPVPPQVWAIIPPLPKKKPIETPPQAETFTATQESPSIVPSEPQAVDTLTAEDNAEAQRIAGELLKLHKAGFIKDSKDPLFFKMLHLIRIFKATVAEPSEAKTKESFI